MQKLSWSNSKQVTYSICNRRFFLKYAPAEAVESAIGFELSQKALGLRNVSNLNLKKGSLVHDAIGDAIVAKVKATHGFYNETPESAATKQALALWEEFYENSAKGIIPDRLIEHVNNVEVDSGAMKATIESYLDSFFSSEFYSKLLEELKECSLLYCPDHYPRYMDFKEKVVAFDGMEFFFLPDLLYIKNDNCIILDFKTGDPKPEDVDQILSYCCLACYKFDIDPDSVVAKLIYIKKNGGVDSENYNLVYSKSTHDTIRKRLVNNYKTMLEPFIFLNNPHPVDTRFPKTSKVNCCKDCQFNTVCFSNTQEVSNQSLNQHDEFPLDVAEELYGIFS